MNETFRNSRWAAAALLPAALLSAAPQTTAPAPPSSDQGAYQGESPDRYAMVRVVEGDVRIRKGDIEDDLTLGTPVGEGDVVESRGRGVLQLGDGTRVAFGGATRFTVASLFTDRSGGKQVLLRLDYGRIRIQLGGQSSVRFKVDTPSGTATCFDHGAFGLEAERDRTTRLLVYDGHVDFANDRNQTAVAAGDRLTVYSPEDGLDRVRSFNTYDSDDFDRWSVRAMVVRRGESWDRVPSELRYYSDELDDHGRWVYADDYGWVWQPEGVAGDWRPYYDGRWAPYSCGMTWISPEPWAYVTYHHGRWNWSVGLGWVWIPGVYYSPAWVAWNSTPGYYGWAPLGYYNTPCHWGYGAWGGGYCWNVVSVNYINVVNVRTRIYSDANVLRTFNTGTGTTTWTGGGRGLTPPWRTTPLMVSHAEFRNPAQIQSAFRPDVNRDRLLAYDRQAQAATGRTVHFRREAGPEPQGSSRSGQAPGSGQIQRVPFEDRTRFVNRERPGGGRDQAPGTAPASRSWTREGMAPRERQPVTPAGPEGRRDAAPQDRTPAPRPRPAPEPRPAPAPQDRREGTVPRERRFDPPPSERRFQDRPEPRDRGEEGRPAPRFEPAPRERSFERPAPAPERREAPAPRERAPEPRPGGGREIRR
ncbi:MAG TPA: DUF6600 domain-containing protein [Holophagaceae bacterium]